MRKRIVEFTVEAINRKVRKQIVAVFIVGIILLMIDMLSGTSGGTIKLVESDGHLYMLRPEKNSETGYLYLTAKVNTADGIVEHGVNIRLEPYEEEDQGTESAVEEDAADVMSKEERIGYELRNMSDSFNHDSTLRKVELPASLDTGEKISWEREKRSNSFLIIMLTLILAAIIYKNRFAALNKKRKEQEESVARELPDFVNRLVLLLNAGLVLNRAFEKTIEESIAFQGDDVGYFNEKMNEIYTSMKTANGVMHVEFRRFARDSGIKELMRISNIINDNVSKGVELTQKLQNESEMLWINRKKNCEERSRMAETKLTLPLVIFLMVLIVIVITPALLEL